MSVQLSSISSGDS
ncbi:unnamed protein product [Linum tenue]|uniref:Uncharacterized protein n=1 Tax=Linum tenue TaxID=586396 RepID=A0AAV0Q3T0_9ROSI|nr:unnamed protein product [Linum tenue]